MRDGQVARFLETSDVLTIGLISFGKPNSKKRLSEILEPTGSVSTRYYLSSKACRGILRRAEKRGKTIPDDLRKALETVASQEPSAPLEQDSTGQAPKGTS